jgi:probable rRNA maturation factor
MKVLWKNTTKHPLSSYKAVAKGYVEDLTQHFGLTHDDVSIIIVGPRVMRRYNKTYRGVDAPTDVLTFVGDPPYLGDVIICYQEARQRATEQAMSVDRYLHFCIVHGLLHAVGMDHQTDLDAATMIDLQDRFIQRRLP